MASAGAANNKIQHTTKNFFIVPLLLFWLEKNYVYLRLPKFTATPPVESKDIIPISENQRYKLLRF
jgi:hypothetical protein